jgi:hypothetical protein
VSEIKTSPMSIYLASFTRYLLNFRFHWNGEAFCFNVMIPKTYLVVIFGSSAVEWMRMLLAPVQNLYLLQLMLHLLMMPHFYPLDFVSSLLNLEKLVSYIAKLVRLFVFAFPLEFS